MNFGKKIGILATIALFVSTFMPVSSSSEFGKKLFISYTFYEGYLKIFPLLVIISSISSFVFILKGRKKLLWVSSLSGVVSVLYPFYINWEATSFLRKAYFTVYNISPKYAAGLELPVLQFGWGFLIASALLVFASMFIHGGESAG